MNIIRQMRLKAKETQQGLADRAGTSQATIAAYENGVKSPTLRTVKRIASSLNMELVTNFVPRLTREDRRSLAFHRMVVEKLIQDPDSAILRARRNLLLLSEMHPHAGLLLSRWIMWLDLPLEDLVSRMLDPAPGPREMRQVSPFSGLLSAAERTAVIKSFRLELAE